MKIETLMIANSATAENGLLSMQGGGWEHCSPAMLPCTLIGAVAGIATIDDEEIGNTPVMNIATTGPDGKDLGFAASMIISGIRPSTVAGVPVRVPFALTFTLAVMSPMVVRVAAIQDGAELAAVTFFVRDPVPDMPPQPG